MVEPVYQHVALTFESDAARASAVLAPANDLLTAECAYCEIPDVVVEDVVIDVFTHEGNELWRPLSRQRHRHHPLEEIRELAQESGLEVAAVGQRPGALLDDELYERMHCKAVFVTRREGRSR